MSASYLIVVGVDGSPGGRRALEWAAHEADARGGAVQAMTAWSWDGVENGPISVTMPQQAEALARETLDREIHALIDRSGSHLPIAAEVVEGRPASVLAEAGCKADLLVLGSHGHSRVRHTVLGSVSEECIRRAACPVVVIPVPVKAPESPVEPASRR